MLGFGILLYTILFLALLNTKKKIDKSNLVIAIFFLLVAHFVSRPSLSEMSEIIPVYNRFISYAWIFLRFYIFILI